MYEIYKKEIKMIKNLSLVMVAFVMLSFSTMKAEKREINIEKSKVAWKGYKVTGSHHGTIILKSGYLSFDEGKLTGGKFIIDMSTLVSLDLSGEYKGKLEGHLKSDDFFGVERYPTASLVLTQVSNKGKNSYTVVGDLTIKGITKPVTFELSVYGSKATAYVKVDRTEYGIRYGSASFFENLQDKAIYDEFDLVADLEF